MDEIPGVALFQAAHHIEFLSKVGHLSSRRSCLTKTFQIYEQYGGSQLTSILEEIKSMTEDVSAQLVDKS